ncbi:MAG TPA: GNAT family N-acetyltransferase [Gemmataceae bacterium]|nr:GNAT family N-acetyltransferase [Gemmataceae bacterium]
MIRPTVPGDTPALVALAEGTGVFKPHDIDTLREVLDDYHAESQAEGHRCVTLEEGGQPVGFAYYAPAPLTDRTWHLWWIAVSKQIQAKGVGSRLLRHVEEDVRAAGGRLLVIETSSTPAYDLTRRFYVKQGYDPSAVLRDFYADGDDICFFLKRLA